MEELNQQLVSLKLKRAQLLSQAEMLSIIDDSLYIKIGKNSFEISQIQKQITRLTVNITNED